MREDDIQRAVFKHLRQRGAKGVFAFHPKNGGVHQRGRRAGINTGMGVIPGVPDVIAVKAETITGFISDVPGRATFGQVYALELKAQGGKPSPVQLDVIEKMRAAGAVADVVVGLDAALRWLEENGLLIGRAA